ncbi:hypothetical protein [Microbacterium sp. AK031]|uniref:hypothetical protein n=1 Tax=Microbacterium sp. AK031 TaxID=2723076 RepID=UPI0037C8D5E9
MGETGLSRTAVTQVIRMLEAGDAVASAGVDRATRRPAATRVSLHPGLGFAAAVHVDHTAMHVSLVDPTVPCALSAMLPLDTSTIERPASPR